DRPSGRGRQLRSPEVAQYAKENRIPLLQTSNINRETEYFKKLENERIELVIVLAFAQFLGDKLLRLPSEGCFNIHTSLLPKYRGAAPIQYALLNGDDSTGVSIQKMVKKMDAGDIAWSSTLNISEDETGGQLYTRLKFQAALSLNDFIYGFSDNDLKFQKQDESKASFAPALKKEDGFLDFKTKTISQLKNQIRALDPWPGTYCMLNSKRIKVFEIQAEKEGPSLAPGASEVKNNKIFVGCKDGAARIGDLQIEGKQRCSDSALLNGLKEKVNINPSNQDNNR
ncbi:MAG: methionyl-tRNA formyltransferase, partial [Bacteriovoracaceae bacterium]